MLVLDLNRETCKIPQHLEQLESWIDKHAYVCLYVEQSNGPPMIPRLPKWW